MTLTRVFMPMMVAAAFATVSCRRAAPESTASAPAASVVQPGAPGQPSRELPPGARPTPLPKHTAADVTFMQGMIHHHAQAIAMVELLKTRTRREDMKRLGQRIEVSQRDEITMMKTWLADRGAEVPMDHGHGMMMMAGAMMGPMPGMLTPDQMTALESATGPAFDRRFLAGMIQHHEGALTMVDELLKAPGAAQESVIFDFVTHVDADQRMEIARMRQMSKDTP
jgi:uncharacterized protein (DUF305 family)